MRVLVVEDEPYMAEAIRDGLRLEAIAADIAADGDTALELLSINAYDIAVLDRDIPGPSGDENFEYGELLPGQRDVAAVPVDLAAERIQTQACDLPHRRPVVPAPAVECSEPEHELS